MTLGAVELRRRRTLDSEGEPYLRYEARRLTLTNVHSLHCYSECAARQLSMKKGWSHEHASGTICTAATGGDECCRVVPRGTAAVVGLIAGDLRYTFT